MVDVAVLMSDYNLIPVPVVDEHRRMVGVVTVDDVLEAALPGTGADAGPRSRPTPITGMARDGTAGRGLRGKERREPGARVLALALARTLSRRGGAWRGRVRCWTRRTWATSRERWAGSGWATRTIMAACGGAC